MGPLEEARIRVRSVYKLSRCRTVDSIRLTIAMAARETRMGTPVLKQQAMLEELAC